MNVQSIHNEAFAKALPPTFLAQALTLAGFHEYGVFTDPQLNGIGNSMPIRFAWKICAHALLSRWTDYLTRHVIGAHEHCQRLESLEAGVPIARLQALLVAV